MKFDMDHSLGFVLNKTSLFSKASFNRQIKKFDISPEQWGLIFRVAEKTGLLKKNCPIQPIKIRQTLQEVSTGWKKKGFSKELQTNQTEGLSIFIRLMKQSAW